MDTTGQSALANGILMLFGCIFLEGGTLFLCWLGYKGTSLRWPQARLAWSLLVVGLTVVVGSLALSTVPGLFGYQATPSPGGIDWNGWVGTGANIGVVVMGAALSWLGLLLFLYPLDASTSDGARLVRRQQVAGVSIFISLTVGGTVALLMLLWTKDVVIEAGTWVAVALVTYPIAFLVLSRVFRKRSQGS